MTVLRSFASAIAGAMLVAVAELPCSSAWNLVLVPVLLLPLSLAASLGVGVGVAAFGRMDGRARLERRLPKLDRIRWSTVAVPTFVVAMMGFYASNVFLVDEPFDRWTLYGYALTVALSVACAAAMRRLVRLRRFSSWIQARLSSSRGVFVLVVMAGGLAASIVDASVLTAAYATQHWILLAGATFLFAAGAYLGYPLIPLPWRGRVAWIAVALWMVDLSVAAQSQVLAQAVDGVIRYPTAGRRLVASCRLLVDRDHDGFSPILGGGDCDDHDPTAFPMSQRGHDCLGWAQARGPAAPRSASRDEPTTTAHATAPKLIVLLTIDAFRCGFGLGDRRELRDACPALTRLAQEGRFRFDGHTNYPATLEAIQIMQADASPLHPDEALNSPRTLGSELQKLGFRTEVISTHRRLLQALAVRAGYRRVDESLAPVAREPMATTSEAVTDKALRWVDEWSTAREPTFLWAHYFDCHSPYVERVGSHLSLVALDGYVQEVRRTDAAIDRLVARLRTLPSGEDIFVYITADHGESFGEHGFYSHGADLHEPSVRVPELAWSPGRLNLASELPSSTDEVPAFLESVARGAPFGSKHMTLLSASPTGDEQFGCLKDGWKLIYHRSLNFFELFDLNTDPDERHECSGARPDRVKALGAAIIGGMW